MRPYARWAALAAIGAVSACAGPPATLHVNIPPFQIDAWDPQYRAVYVQDWDHAAQKIADGLTDHNLMRPINAQVAEATYSTGGFLLKSESPPATSPVFFIRIDQNWATGAGGGAGGGPPRPSMFLRQLKAALETEITRRGGLIANAPGMGVEVDLRVDVVRWGSLRDDEPYALRREAVWQATVSMGQMTALSFREPFYISDSDIPLYEDESGLAPGPLRTVAGTDKPSRD